MIFCAAFVSKRTLPPIFSKMLTTPTHRRSRDLSRPGTWKMRPPNLELSTIFVPAKYHLQYMHYRSLIQFTVTDLDSRQEISDPELFRLDGDTGTVQLQHRTEKCSSTNNYNMAGVTFFQDKYSPIDMHYCSTPREHSDRFPTSVVPNYFRSRNSDEENIGNNQQHIYTRTESKVNQPTQSTPAPLLTQGGSQVIPYMGTVILVSILSNTVCRLLILFIINQTLKITRLRLYVTCRHMLISADRKMKLEYRDMATILRPESNLLSPVLVTLAVTSIVLACYQNLLTVCLLLCSPSCKTHENARGRKKLRLGPSTCALPPPSAATESPPPNTRVTDVKNTPPYTAEITSCTSGSSAARQNEQHGCYTLYKLTSPKYTSNVSREPSCICKYNTRLRERIDVNSCRITATDPVYSCILICKQYTYALDEWASSESSRHSTISCARHLYNFNNSMITPTQCDDVTYRYDTLCKVAAANTASSIKTNRELCATLTQVVLDKLITSRDSQSRQSQDYLPNTTVLLLTLSKSRPSLSEYLSTATLTAGGNTWADSPKLNGIKRN